jgi:hypothetical protein
LQAKRKPCFQAETSLFLKGLFLLLFKAANSIAFPLIFPYTDCSQGLTLSVMRGQILGESSQYLEAIRKGFESRMALRTEKLTLC